MEREISALVDSSWNVMAHGEGKWRGNLRMEWVASTLHTTSEHGISSITTADAHTSAASSWLNWSPRQFKWTGPFQRKTKSGFCVCAITFQLASTLLSLHSLHFLTNLFLSYFQQHSTRHSCEIAAISLHSHRPFVQSVATHSETTAKGLSLNDFLPSSAVAYLRQCKCQIF